VIEGFSEEHQLEEAKMNRRLVVGIVSFAALLYVCGIYLVWGAENKEVTISGELVCGHCTLHAVDACAGAVKTADGDYLFVKNPESDKVFDQRLKGLKVEVTGTVEEKDGQKWLTVTKIVLEEK
jgi:hypothetical protein